MKHESYRFLTVQVEPDPDALRTEEVRGDSYLVAPVVAVAEGVLNGGFLPYSEIQMSAPGWNGVPLTVNHPEGDDGEFVPANQSDVLERFQIGRFLNAEADDDGRRLAGELWIKQASVEWMSENVDDLGEEATQTVEMLKNGDPLEVSTGYWHGVENDAGEFEGQEYDEVQVDLLPDHLAVLPNSEGACNWDGDSTTSGCGAPRTQMSTPAANADGGGLAFAANCGDADCDGDCNGGGGSAANGSPESRFRTFLQEAFGFDLGDTDATTTVSYAQNRANPAADTPKMGITNDDDRLEAIANASTFEVEALREMDDQTVEQIEASLDMNDDGGDGGDGDGTGDGGDGGSADGGDDPDDPGQDGSGNAGGQTLADMTVEDFDDRIRQVVQSEQANETREELKSRIVANSNFEEDELPDDVEKLESMADKLDAQTSTQSRYDGRAAGTNDGGEFDPDDVEVGGALTALEAEESD